VKGPLIGSGKCTYEGDCAYRATVSIKHHGQLISPAQCMLRIKLPMKASERH
jgi:hypothetical protein